jgi:hypothetical protein
MLSIAFNEVRVYAKLSSPPDFWAYKKKGTLIIHTQFSS